VKTPILLALMLCCGHSATQQGRYAPQNAPPSGATELTSASVESPNLIVSNEIMQRCKITFDNTETAPRFAFDESVLDTNDAVLLAQVAKCLTEGPLAGRTVKLVGRADPRGELEYNMSLGARRANAADRFLVNMGVKPSNVHETSRGKLDATGTDEPGWARDRRVDIDLE
jgi:peptidoglycan-associated lipoprotein